MLMPLCSLTHSPLISMLKNRFFFFINPFCWSLYLSFLFIYLSIFLSIYLSIYLFLFIIKRHLYLYLLFNFLIHFIYVMFSKFTSVKIVINNINSTKTNFILSTNATRIKSAAISVPIQSLFHSCTPPYRAENFFFLRVPKFTTSLSFHFIFNLVISICISHTVGTPPYLSQVPDTPGARRSFDFLAIISIFCANEFSPWRKTSS